MTKWLKRRERKRRDLEDTIRFPRFRRGSVDGNGRGVWFFSLEVVSARTGKIPNFKHQVIPNFNE